MSTGGAARRSASFKRGAAVWTGPPGFGCSRPMPAETAGSQTATAISQRRVTTAMLGLSVLAVEGDLGWLQSGKGEKEVVG